MTNGGWCYCWAMYMLREAGFRSGEVHKEKIYIRYVRCGRGSERFTLDIYYTYVCHTHRNTSCWCASLWLNGRVDKTIHWNVVTYKRWVYNIISFGSFNIKYITILPYFYYHNENLYRHHCTLLFRTKYISRLATLSPGSQWIQANQLRHAPARSHILIITFDEYVFPCASVHLAPQHMYMPHVWTHVHEAMWKALIHGTSVRHVQTHSWKSICVRMQCFDEVLKHSEWAYVRGLKSHAVLRWVLRLR